MLFQRITILRFFLGAYGAACAKATIVWSNSEQLLNILDIPFDKSEFCASVATATYATTADGRKAVTGSSDLKSTQPATYTTCSVCRCALAHKLGLF